MGTATAGYPYALRSLLENLPVFPAARKDGQRLSAEGMDHAGGVDAAPAGRLVPRIDVGAIFESQAVDGDGAVEGRVGCEGDYQETIV